LELELDELIRKLNEAIDLSSPVTQEHNGRAERLRAAHAEAVGEIERIRNQPGQLTTGINGEVGRSILEAGVRALADVSDDQEAKQFVVAAPPGTGKTSHAIALMAATVQTADTDDLSRPFGCLFVVDQIKKADDMYRQMNDLMPGEVAVWTVDHDPASTKPTQVFVPYEHRFDVDQLERRAIVVVTQAFLRGPRGSKARHVLRGGHRIARALTIFDEQTKEVEVYDIKQSQAMVVKEALERDPRHRHLKENMEPLLTFLHEQSKQTGNSIDIPSEGWDGFEVSRQLHWFASEEAEKFVLTNARDIPHLEEVFGFAAQMHNNYAFVFRLGCGANGSHFMGYVPAARPSANSILLDATADIDKVSDLCSWRSHVPVPSVRYDHLQVIHAEHYTRENLTEFFRSDSNRRKYVESAKRLILDVMPSGACGLIVCRKRLVDEGLFSEEATRRAGGASEDQRFPWNFEGRHLAVTWWGGHGIGANDWRRAAYVFQLGEHVLPKRTTFAVVQGLRDQMATMGMLSSTKSANSKPKEVEMAHEGHLLRFMKQLGMRGRARAFDSDGICGHQVLVLTCEFERLLANADLLFPGASLSKWGRTQNSLGDLKQAEKLMEILTDPDTPESISGDDIAKRMGVERWGLLSTNVLTPKIKERVLPNLGWTYEAQRGRGGGARFVKTGSGVLNPMAHTRPAIITRKCIRHHHNAAIQCTCPCRNDNFVDWCFNRL
jgi:hypothetical protein